MLRPRTEDEFPSHLILNTPPFTAGTLALGFPKGSSATLPFGQGQGSYPAREVKLIWASALISRSIGHTAGTCCVRQ